jgi:hypothetical protein
VDLRLTGRHPCAQGWLLLEFIVALARHRRTVAVAATGQANRQDALGRLILKAIAHTLCRQGSTYGYRSHLAFEPRLFWTRATYIPTSVRFGWSPDGLVRVSVSVPPLAASWGRWR